jgi:hypothetical protein
MQTAAQWVGSSAIGASMLISGPTARKLTQISYDVDPARDIFGTAGVQAIKKARQLHEPASLSTLVGVARIELATPAMSTQCSTTELHAHERWAD